jgi:hypothetical protein
MGGITTNGIYVKGKVDDDIRWGGAAPEITEVDSRSRSKRGDNHFKKKTRPYITQNPTIRHGLPEIVRALNHFLPTELTPC